METLAIASFLALVNEKLIEYLSAPIKKKFPNLDTWWLLYVALITGAGIAWLSGVNLFTAYIPDAMTGRILTSIAVGGGSSLLHDLFGN